MSFTITLFLKCIEYSQILLSNKKCTTNKKMLLIIQCIRDLIR